MWEQVWTADETVSALSEPCSISLRVLIVDDAGAGRHIVAALREEGIATEFAPSGQCAFNRKAEFRPDVVLVDPGPPSSAAVAMVGRLAGDGACGVIVLTEPDTETTRIAMLDTGADDVVGKRASPRELAARVRAVHRRVQHGAKGDMRPGGAKHVVDSVRRCVIGPDGTVTFLTEAEVATLEALLRANGAVISRDTLCRVALRRPASGADRSVDQLILKIRRKLQSCGVPERFIQPSRSRGYAIPEPKQFTLIVDENDGSFDGGQCPHPGPLPKAAEGVSPSPAFGRRPG